MATDDMASHDVTTESVSGVTETFPSIDGEQGTDHHWPTGFKVTWMLIVLLIIAIIGILGNGTVITVMILKKSLRKNFTSGYILNQCCIDILSAFLIIATKLTSFINGSHVNNVGDVIFCKLWMTEFFLWALMISSSYNIVMITLERYMAVVFPIWYKIKFDRRKFVTSLVLVWLSGPLINSYIVIVPSVRDGICNPYGYWPSTQAMKAVGITEGFLQFFVPVAIHIFCHSKMAWVMSRKRRVVEGETPREGNGNGTGVAESIPKVAAKKPVISEVSVKISRNIFKTCVIITVCFICCWAWNSILFFGFYLGMPVDFASVATEMSIVLVFVNCCINPFVYISRCGPFQIALCSLFSKAGTVTVADGTGSIKTTKTTA